MRSVPDYRFFAATRNVPRIRFGSEKRAKPLIGRAADQLFETDADRLRVGGCAAGCFRLPQQIFIDIERLLDTYDLTIYVWRIEPASMAIRSAAPRYAQKLNLTPN